MNAIEYTHQEYGQEDIRPEMLRVLNEKEARAVFLSFNKFVPEREFKLNDIPVIK